MNRDLRDPEIFRRRWQVRQQTNCNQMLLVYREGIIVEASRAIMWFVYVYYRLRSHTTYYNQ